jgi:hypothetical protein
VRTPTLLVAAALTCGAAAEALAQPQERVAISVNGAIQTTKNPFSDRFDFPVNRDTGSTETEYPVKGDLVIDGSVVIRLWKNLGAGVAVSQFTRDETVTTTSEIPHPFFFDTLREVSGDASVTRTERGIHVHAAYTVPLVRSLRLTIFAGPSFIRVEQAVVSNVQYDESFPFDTATFRRAETTRVSGDAVGFNAGADVAWMFTRNVGIGGLARFARATVDVDFPGSRPKSLEAGGFAGGGGLRIVF